MNHAGARKVKKKRKKKQRLHKEPFIFIHFTDSDLKYYGPDYCEDHEEAIRKAKEDISFVARKEGYKKNQIFKPNVSDILRRVDELWQE